MVAKQVLVTNEEQDNHTGTYTRNIVYKEVLGEIWLLQKYEANETSMGRMRLTPHNCKIRHCCPV